MCPPPLHRVKKINCIGAMLPRAGRQDVSEMDAAVKAALQGTGARTRTPGGMLEEEGGQYRQLVPIFCLV